jgi:hypothetical protein
VPIPNGLLEIGIPGSIVAEIVPYEVVIEVFRCYPVETHHKGLQTAMVAVDVLNTESPVHALFRMYSYRDCFLSGRRMSGSFSVADIAGKVLADSVSYKKLTLKHHNNTYIMEEAVFLSPTKDG